MSLEGPWASDAALKAKHVDSQQLFVLTSALGEEASHLGYRQILRRSKGPAP